MSEANGCDTLLLTCNAKAANLKTFPLSTSIVSWSQKQNGGVTIYGNTHANKEQFVRHTWLESKSCRPVPRSHRYRPNHPARRGRKKTPTTPQTVRQVFLNSNQLKARVCGCGEKLAKRTKAQGKVRERAFLGSVPPHGRWYVPKAGSTVSVSHGDRSALPAKKKNNPALQRLITRCVHVHLVRHKYSKQTFKETFKCDLIYNERRLPNYNYYKTWRQRLWQARVFFFPPPSRIEKAAFTLEPNATYLHAIAWIVIWT